MDGLKQAIMDFLLKMFSADLFDNWMTAVKGFIDGVLDELEDKIQEEPDWYDARVLGLIAGLRDAFNIPDNDAIEDIVADPVAEDPEPEVKPVDDPYTDEDG